MEPWLNIIVAQTAVIRNEALRCTSVRAAKFLAMLRLFLVGRVAVEEVVQVVAYSASQVDFYPRAITRVSGRLSRVRVLNDGLSGYHTPLIALSLDCD